MISANAKTVFECSWEVCNKAGGIYTVISSKAIHMLKYYNEYYAVGPYIKNKADPEFKKEDPPRVLKEIFYELLSEAGIVCHYGSWLVAGEPKAILIEFDSIKHKINYLKEYFWEKFKVDSLHCAWDFEEPMLWSYATGLLIDKYQKKTGKQRVIGHFHEWLSGFGMLHLKVVNPLVKTVFTTHATMLGRSLAYHGRDIYSDIKNINPEEEARRINVMDKFSMERACAQNADVFTTVSEITGKEAEKILSRKPEVLTLNGFNVDEFPTIEETSLMHLKARKKLREYITYHFFPFYPIELEHNLIFSTYGRPEVRNKGMNIFIKALGKLNRYLKQDHANKRTITAFFWPLQDNKGPKIELLQDKENFNHIKEYIEENASKIFDDILYDIMYDRPINVDTSLSRKFLLNMRKSRFSLKRQGNPLVCAYNLDNEQNNEIVKLLLKEGLNNSIENPVKVVLYPTDLNNNNTLIEMDLYGCISGCHLTVLPSYYEPWGYTPLESAAVGVPTVTSDLSGFGKFIKKRINNEKLKGIFVLERYQKSELEATEKLFQIMKYYSFLKHHERVQAKVKAKELSFYADWKILIEYYIKAHNLALKK